MTISAPNRQTLSHCGEKRLASMRLQLAAFVIEMMLGCVSA